jgi:hypothetical protein
MGMCMQVPSWRSSSARALAITAFACYAAGVVMYLLGSVINWTTIGMTPLGWGGNPAGGCITLLSYPVWVAGFIVWLFFLRSVCLQLRNSETAGKVMAVFIGYLCFAGLCVLLGIIMAIIIAAAASSVVSRGGAGAAGTFGATAVILIIMYLLILAGAIAMNIWYCFVLQGVRDVVGRRVAKM